MADPITIQNNSKAIHEKARLDDYTDDVVTKARKLAAKRKRKRTKVAEALLTCADTIKAAVAGPGPLNPMPTVGGQQAPAMPMQQPGLPSVAATLQNNVYGPAALGGLPGSGTVPSGVKTEGTNINGWSDKPMSREKTAVEPMPQSYIDDLQGSPGPPIPQDYLDLLRPPQQASAPAGGGGGGGDIAGMLGKMLGQGVGGAVAGTGGEIGGPSEGPAGPAPDAQYMRTLEDSPGPALPQDYLDSLRPPDDNISGMNVAKGMGNSLLGAGQDLYDNAAGAAGAMGDMAGGQPLPPEFTSALTNESGPMAGAADGLNAVSSFMNPAQHAPAPAANPADAAREGLGAPPAGQANQPNGGSGVADAPAGAAGGPSGAEEPGLWDQAKELGGTAWEGAKGMAQDAYTGSGYDQLPMWAQLGIPAAALGAGGLGYMMGGRDDEEEEAKYASLRDVVVQVLEKESA